jgi:hypothetical protein
MRDARKSRIKPSMLEGYGPRLSQSGPVGKRGNLERLRYLCLHSDAERDSGEAQGGPETLAMMVTLESLGGRC